MANYLLKNARVIDGDSDENRDLYISNSKIAQPEGHIDEDVETVECDGHLILPGGIDTHTHMGIPIKGGYSVDDFQSGSHAAMHGGITSIIDFSILNPEDSLSVSVDRRISEASRSICDFGIHCNVTRMSPEILDEIPKLIASGITSFKVFTTYEEASMMLSYNEIEVLAKRIAQHDGILMVHAEDNAIIRSSTEQFDVEDNTGAKYHEMSRPVAAEVVAIRQIGELAKRTGCKTYIVHISSGQGLQEALRYGLMTETCPQYLFLDDNVYRGENENMFVASPPIRSHENSQVLLDAVLSKKIMTIGTDHCPFNLRDKEGVESFRDIPNGMGGVETSFPLLLAHFLENDYSLSLLARLTSENAARIFGLFPQKGSLKNGADADLMIIDPKTPLTGWENQLKSNSDWCAFAGMPAIFPKHVFRRGQWVIRNGELQNRDEGQFLSMEVPREINPTPLP